MKDFSPLHTLRLIPIPLLSLKNHIHLFKEFVMRDIRGRFAGTAGGMLWSLLNPLVTILVYIFIFGNVIRIPLTVQETGTDRFAVYFFTGFFPWLFLSESLSRSAGVLLENANLITKVVFPVELLPMGTVCSVFLINGTGALITLIYMGAIGYFHFTWLMLLFFIPVYLTFICGLSFLIAAISVFIRDMREILGIILMVWFYAVPIIYPISMVPESIRDLVIWNPVTRFVFLYRELILLHRIHWMLFVEITLISLLIYGIGSWFFMRAKSAFGDVL